jgi:hypothetical protein
VKIRVTPRAGRTTIAGRRGDALVVKLSAAPVDGAANDALIAFLAETFDRPRRDVTIVSGLTSRDKRVAIAGLSDEEVHQHVSAILSKL